MTKIASFNVNSIRARMPNVLAWLEEFGPDIALLQEIKSTEETFPRMELEAAGYNIEIIGQKNYNGVAIFSKSPMEVTETHLPGDDNDKEARYIEAITETGAGVLRVASIYLPNGNPINPKPSSASNNTEVISNHPPDGNLIDSKYFKKKLDWMERLLEHAQSLLTLEEAVVLGGDYNIIPQNEDCYDPEEWLHDALFHRKSRGAFRRLCALGYTDAFRTFHQQTGKYTFWDYTKRRWQKDEGIRIDHLMLSPQAADRLRDCQIDREPRAQQNASDHTPIWCELAL
ncbi:MAG: exodeoxyribonuclease III [Rhodospirillaceae bacterium]|nr:exodeoxyribonuclease III [Rhodospirillaceae bacterium]